MKTSQQKQTMLLNHLYELLQGLIVNTQINKDRVFK